MVSFNYIQSTAEEATKTIKKVLNYWTEIAERIKNGFKLFFEKCLLSLPPILATFLFQKLHYLLKYVWSSESKQWAFLCKEKVGCVEIVYKLFTEILTKQARYLKLQKAITISHVTLFDASF